MAADGISRPIKGAYAVRRGCPNRAYSIDITLAVRFMPRTRGDLRCAALMEAAGSLDT